jgi:hypothetical protein
MNFHWLLEWSFVRELGSLLGHFRDRTFDGCPTLTSSHMVTCWSDIFGPELGILPLKWSLQHLLKYYVTPKLHLFYHSIFYKTWNWKAWLNKPLLFFWVVFVQSNISVGFLRNHFSYRNNLNVLYYSDLRCSSWTFTVSNQLYYKLQFPNPSFLQHILPAFLQSIKMDQSINTKTVLIYCIVNWI